MIIFDEISDRVVGVAVARIRREVVPNLDQEVGVAEIGAEKVFSGNRKW